MAPRKCVFLFLLFFIYFCERERIIITIKHRTNKNYVVRRWCTLLVKDYDIFDLPIHNKSIFLDRDINKWYIIWKDENQWKIVVPCHLIYILYNMKLIRHFQVIFDKIGNKIFLTEIKCLSVWKIKDSYNVYAGKKSWKLKIG